MFSQGSESFRCHYALFLSTCFNCICSVYFPTWHTCPLGIFAHSVYKSVGLLTRQPNIPAFFSFSFWIEPSRRSSTKFTATVLRSTLAGTIRCCRTPRRRDLVTVSEPTVTTACCQAGSSLGIYIYSVQLIARLIYVEVGKLYNQCKV